MLTVVASLGSSLSIGSVIIGLLVTIAGVVAAGSIVLSRRTEATRLQQDSTITALQGSIVALQTDASVKDAQLLALKTTCATQAEQITMLTAQVTQAAKVDELRNEVAAQAKATNDRLEELVTLLQGHRSTE